MKKWEREYLSYQASSPQPTKPRKLTSAEVMINKWEPRRMLVLDLLIFGATSKQIAEHIGFSHKRAIEYIRDLKGKLERRANHRLRQWQKENEEA